MLTAQNDYSASDSTVRIDNQRFFMLREAAEYVKMAVSETFCHVLIKTCMVTIVSRAAGNAKHEFVVLGAQPQGLFPLNGKTIPLETKYRKA